MPIILAYKLNLCIPVKFWESHKGDSKNILASFLKNKSAAYSVMQTSRGDLVNFLSFLVISKKK